MFKLYLHIEQDTIVCKTIHWAVAIRQQMIFKGPNGAIM